jgi:hypothetical protein
MPYINTKETHPLSSPRPKMSDSYCFPPTKNTLDETVSQETKVIFLSKSLVGPSIGGPPCCMTEWVLTRGSPRSTLMTLRF